MSSKEILREEIKKRLKDVSPEEFRLQGDKAAAILRASQVWASHKTIFLFLSMKSEIETQSLLEAALSDGKKVFAPRVEDGRLVFYSILPAQGQFRRGPFGIKEPADGKPAETGDFPALILTPGLAFDREGRRMGRGKGYYDRFFAELDHEAKQYHALGLCMDFQLIDKVPIGEHDKKVQSLLAGEEMHILIQQS